MFKILSILFAMLIVPFHSMALECFVYDDRVVCENITIEMSDIGEYMVTVDGGTTKYREAYVGGHRTKLVGDGNVVVIDGTSVKVNDDYYKCWNRNGKVTCREQ